MNQIRQSMVKAAQELRALAKKTDDASLRVQLLEQADQLEQSSQEDSQDETHFASRRTVLEFLQMAQS